MNPPRRRIDRLALAVHAMAVIAIVAASSWLIVQLRTHPEPSTPAVEDRRLTDAVSGVRRWLDEQRMGVEPAKPVPPPRPKPAPPFELVDLRPMKEKRDHDALESQGFQILGDERLVPDRLSVLRGHLTARTGDRLAAKHVQLTRLMTLQVRTPKEVPAENPWGIADMGAAQYWIICDIAFAVDGQAASGRAIRRFDGNPRYLAAQHRSALLGAVDQAITRLPLTSNTLPPFQLVDRRGPAAKADIEGGNRLALVREQLAQYAGERLAGKKVELSELTVSYVRHPKPGERAPGAPEMIWTERQTRQSPYWVFCDLRLAVNGKSAAGRSMLGFDNEADLPLQQRRLVVEAIEDLIEFLLRP